MPQPSFIHLRLHSEYSISDGMVRVGEAVSAAKNDGMPALALTDLNSMFGSVREIFAALETNNDLPRTWQVVKHTEFKKLFGVKP